MAQTKVQLVSNIVGNVSGGASFTGIVTAAGGFSGSLTGTASTATSAATAYGLTGSPNIVVGVATLGVTTITNLTAQTLNVSGISTLGSVKVSSGIVTAVAGVVTYYGDGSQLTGVAAAGSGGANDITSNLFF